MYISAGVLANSCLTSDFSEPAVGLRWKPTSLTTPPLPAVWAASCDHGLGWKGQPKASVHLQCNTCPLQITPKIYIQYQGWRLSQT